MDIQEELRIAHAPATSSACVQAPPLSISQRLRTLRARFHITHVPNYIWSALFTALGGFVFGFDTGSIGSITVMSQFQEQFSKTGHLSSTVQGLIVSTILITAAIASLVSGPLSDRISRTRTIALGAIVFAAGSVISCSAHALAQLLVGRCVAGVGEGLFLSAITVYAIEIAPASARGRLGSVVQLLVTTGIAAGMWKASTLALPISMTTKGILSVTAPCVWGLHSRGVFLLACRRLYPLCLPWARPSYPTPLDGCGMSEETRKPKSHG